MRRCVLSVAVLAAMSAPALSQAYLIQPAQPQPPRASVQHTGSVQGVQPGSLGGGFIEFLVTGRDGSAHVQRPGMIQEPRAAAPRSVQPARQPIAQPSPFEDPITGQSMLPPSRQMAAVSPRAEIERPIERVLDNRFARQEVDYRGPHGAGTIVIDTNAKFLFLVQGGGRAIRYGIGVGRPGFEWAGVKSVTRKAEWPDWRPPAAMLKRRPDLPRFMEGGENNPLGARALYLGSSLYRIHGTNEPHSIGQAVSSGCIRMTNDDVTDLYDRVRVGTRVIVM